MGGLPAPVQNEPRYMPIQIERSYVLFEEAINLLVNAELTNAWALGSQYEVVKSIDEHLASIVEKLEDERLTDTLRLVEKTKTAYDAWMRNLEYLRRKAKTRLRAERRKEKGFRFASENRFQNPKKHDRTR